MKDERKALMRKVGKLLKSIHRSQRIIVVFTSEDNGLSEELFQFQVTADRFPDNVCRGYKSATEMMSRAYPNGTLRTEVFVKN